MRRTYAKFVDLVAAYRRMPRVTIALDRSAEAEAFFELATSRHPKIPLLRRKEFGVALLELPETFDSYLQLSKALRQRRSRANRAGYNFRSFDVQNEIDAIMRINLSSVSRQGRAMDQRYFNRDDVLRFHTSGGRNFGVYDERGDLVAYCCVPIFGDVALLNRLLGHADHLRNDIMYLMVTEVLSALIAARPVHPRLRWLQYDMWFGASEGLRFFKKVLGFKPYWVKWILPKNET